MNERIDDALYEFNGSCGQCTFPPHDEEHGDFVAIGSWKLMVYARAEFISHHEFHVPVELKIERLQTAHR